MYYETSNIIFAQKPTGAMMRKKYPFKFGTQVHLVEDSPKNLYALYTRGFTFKPHPFDFIKQPESAIVHAIVLDFDHLSKEQCEHVKSKCDNQTIFGDYSAGTKTRLYENRDIPNYENPKWGYKVFYPVDCLCVYEELNEAFLGAVAFFNGKSIDKTKRVWSEWKKANNRKDKISNPIFDSWILPDVAMLNSFRTQLTYGVKPELNGKDLKLDVEKFPKHDIYSIMAFQTKGKEHYSGLEWKPYQLEILKEVDIKEDIQKAWIDKVLNLAWENVMANDMDIINEIYTPISKSNFRRHVKQNKFEDLVLDEERNRILSFRMFGGINKPKDMAKGREKCFEIAGETTRTLTYNMMELGYQMGIDTHDTLKNRVNSLLHDIICVVRRSCGLNIMNILSRREIEKMRNIIFKTMLKVSSNYIKIRTRIKADFMASSMENTPQHMKILKSWRETKDNSLLSQYNIEREKWEKENVKKIMDFKMPYTYTRKGLKKHVISICVGFEDEIMDNILKLERRMEKPEDWLAFCKSTINENDGEITDETLLSWYKDYKREWNKKWSDSKIHKQHKQHKSKYAEIFKDMSKEEIAQWIKTSDIHDQTKSRLRKKYL